MNFKDILGEQLWNQLKTTKALEGITSPTPIQEQALPLILQGKDVLFQSPTGTGKTLAYLLPIFAKMHNQGNTNDTKPDTKSIQAIILAPTYELAAQIAQVARGLSSRPEDVALLIGGAAKTRQAAALKLKPRVAVGTPGRIADFMAEKKLSLHHVKTLVFDEADRLFTEQNLETIEKLIKATLKDRQILLVSATIPKKTADLAKPLMKNPETIRLGDKIPKNIKHFYTISEGRKKNERLRSVIHNHKINKVLVFVNMPYTIENTAKRLDFHKIPCKSLHSGADKITRKAAMDALRLGKIRALVASDAGSRGLDIQNLKHVINLDLPAREKDYLHRAGRCGRAGTEGTVISIVTKNELETLKKMAKKLGIEITEL
jgi:superfamily II DNA/RNA helicase